MSRRQPRGQSEKSDSVPSTRRQDSERERERDTHGDTEQGGGRETKKEPAKGAMKGNERSTGCKTNLAVSMVNKTQH